MRGLLLFIAWTILSVLPAFADNWTRALILFDAGQYEQSLDLLMPFAEDGNLEAQEILYSAYSYGYGVSIDDTEALRWLRRSAELGAEPAQVALAERYRDGRGVSVDETEALAWFRKAAQQGYPPALFQLGVMTAEGSGIPADPEEGLRLVRWAAELDNPDALYLLAVADAGQWHDIALLDRSIKALGRAARQGHAPANALLGMLLEDFPEDPHHAVKSAFFYQMAVEAGCIDVTVRAKQARGRLSGEEIVTLEDNLARYRFDFDPRDPGPVART